MSATKECLTGNLQEESLICTNDSVFNHPGVWERKEGGKERIKGTVGKESASLLPRTGVLWLVGGVTLPPWKLAWASFIPYEAWLYASFFSL